MKKILVLLAHTDPTSYTAQLANAYESAASNAGHEVIRVNIGDLTFDPILHMGYKEIQPLEPDLLLLQERFKEADHIVILLPGFAFNFDKTTHKIVQHLKGKSARVIVVAGTLSPFQTWWKYGDYTNEIRHSILEFAGLTTKVTAFGPCERTTQECRSKWIREVEVLGTRGI